MKKLILLVPFLFILGGIPLANRIHPQVFGFPFVLFLDCTWDASRFTFSFPRLSS